MFTFGFACVMLINITEMIDTCVMVTNKLWAVCSELNQQNIQWRFFIGTNCYKIITRSFKTNFAVKIIGSIKNIYHYCFLLKRTTNKIYVFFNKLYFHLYKFNFTVSL